MQILAALLNMSALGSLFTEDKYESQRYRSLQDRRHIIANNENCWKFIYLTYNNLQKSPKILCRLCLDFNWEFEFNCHSWNCWSLLHEWGLWPFCENLCKKQRSFAYIDSNTDKTSRINSVKNNNLIQDCV